MRWCEPQNRITVCLKMTEHRVRAGHRDITGGPALESSEQALPGEESRLPVTQHCGFSEKLSLGGSKRMKTLSHENCLRSAHSLYPDTFLTKEL